MDGIEIDRMKGIGKRVGLNAHHPEVLPLLEMSPVGKSPRWHVRRQRLSGDLQWEELVLGSQRRATDESTSGHGIERAGHKIVEHDCLRSRSGVPVEDFVWKEAIDMRELLGHVVPAKLTGGIAQTIRMPGVTGKEHQSDVFIGIRRENDSPRSLFQHTTVAIDVFDADCAAIAIGQDPSHPRVSTQSEIVRATCERHQLASGMPFVAIPRAKPVVPGAVGKLRNAVMLHGRLPHRSRVRVQTSRPGSFCEGIAQHEWAGWRQRQWLGTLDVRIRFVSGYTDKLLDICER